MCFSEQASFSAAAVLSLISIGAFRMVKNNPKLYALASIPLFFGIQQAAEGIQWLHFKGIWGTDAQAEIARNFFLFFAYFFWPVWLPFGLYLAEKSPKKKQILGIFSLAGIAFAIYAGWQISHGLITTTQENYSVQYITPIPLIELIPYMILVFVPWFISTRPRMAATGVAFIVSALVAGYIYTANFTSVWCFFAAIVSISLILALKASVNETPFSINSTKQKS